jgi:hypothetical protein
MRSLQWIQIEFMKTFKKIDYWGQLGVLVTCIMWAVLTGEIYPVFLIYFIVGGWQVLSFIIHMSLGKENLLKKERNTYGQVLLWVAGFGLASLIHYSLIYFYLSLMLVISPIIAIWYFSICVREVQSLSKEELIT